MFTTSITVQNKILDGIFFGKSKILPPCLLYSWQDMLTYRFGRNGKNRLKILRKSLEKTDSFCVWLTTSACDETFCQSVRTRAWKTDETTPRGFQWPPPHPSSVTVRSRDRKPRLLPRTDIIRSFIHYDSHFIRVKSHPPFCRCAVASQLLV